MVLDRDQTESECGKGRMKGGEESENDSHFWLLNRRNSLVSRKCVDRYAPLTPFAPLMIVDHRLRRFFHSHRSPQSFAPSGFALRQ